MKILIHRGASEIGGSCIELMHNGKSILLDYGRPLDANAPIVPHSLLPERISAIIASHLHQDHIGMADSLAVPVYIGTQALAMLREAAVWVSHTPALDNAVAYQPLKAFEVAGFRITPYPVDHSAFDSYAFLIEAGGKRVFYSGDFRDSGYTAYKTERLFVQPPQDIDLLLMEGTTIGSVINSAGFATHGNTKEADLIDMICTTVKPAGCTVEDNAGMVLFAASSQNIDRLVTAYKAANKLGRKFVIDAYAYSMLKATGVKSIQSALANMLVYIPQYQRVKIKNEQLFDKLCPRKQRIFIEELAQSPEKYLILYRNAHIYDFSVDMLKNAIVLYSQWSGYLTGDSHIERFVQQHGLPLRHVHTSGHADIATLQRLAQALKPKVLVPVHSEYPELYSEYFENVKVVSEINL
ncbi:MAG: MBL fold metallo-hydrolase [Deferribacteraceae bacterium]|jgi:ribonuclease J|nr:MBL fold metallo-hydrolase [Deferribacteraceae bacterium]